MKKIENKTYREWIQESQQEAELTMWGKKFGCFCPELCKRQIGDGLQLIEFWTYDNRPRYWLVKVDSGIKNNDDFPYEAVIDLIRDQFGDCKEDCEICNREGRCDYPAISYQTGTGWDCVVNFGIKKTTPTLFDILKAA